MQILGFGSFWFVVLIVGKCESERASSYDEAEDILLIAALNGSYGIEEMYGGGGGGGDGGEIPEEIGTELYSENTIESVGVDGDDRNIRFLLYARSFTGIDNGTQIYIGNVSHLLDSGFNVDAPTKIICHGYMSSYRRGPGLMLIPAYFEASKNRPLNIISINWSGMSGLFRSYMKRIYHGLYFPPARNTEIVGNSTGAIIEFLVNELGMDLSDFHLIGHSLGAHVMGYAGRYLRNRLGRSVARITALDPAGPCFETFRRACFRGKFHPISRNDADFVDAIHTHAWALGMKKPVGHVDFYPNGGFSQPGCFKLTWGALFKSLSGICSHKRAIELMRESILSKGQEIRAHPCHDLNSASKGTCPFQSEDYTLLGEPCSPFSKGIYFLKTNSKSPFISLHRNKTGWLWFG